MEKNEKILTADHWRGLDFYSPKLDDYSSVTIIGCGAIGSYTAFGLARLGVKKITLVDFDTVENHNLPNQFFAESLNIKEGIFKTAVLEATIKLMVKNTIITTFPMKIEQVPEKDWLNGRGAIITAVDDMNVRKFIYQQMKQSNYSGLLLDPRIGGLFANIYSIDFEYVKATEYYESSLYSNEAAAPLPCTGQSICDVSMAVSGELVGRYRTHAMGNDLPAFHTFHDYKIGHSWIQEQNPYFSLTAKTKEESEEIQILEDEE